MDYFNFEIKDSPSCIPSYDFSFKRFGFGYYTDNIPEWFTIDLCETFPYAPDGEVPMMFLNIWKLQMWIEWSWLYRKIYKNRYQIELE